MTGWSNLCAAAGAAAVLAGGACSAEPSAAAKDVGLAADGSNAADSDALAGIDAGRRAPADVSSETASVADSAVADSAVADAAGTDAKQDAAPGDAAGGDVALADTSPAAVGGADAGCTTDCSDNNPCTKDSCTAGTCVNTPMSGSCDDGDPCSEADSCAQGKCAGKKQYWVKEFGGPGDDAGLAVAVTGTDTVIVGFGGGGSGGDRYSTFLRLDKLGATKAQESYPAVGNDELTALVATDKGWLAVGTVVQPSKEMQSRAVLVDENGTLLQQLPLGAGELYGVAPVPTGGYLAAGYREDSLGTLKLLLMKLGPDGGKQWEQLHGTSGFEVAWGLASLPDGGAVSIGDTAPGGLGPHLSLQRFDAVGKSIWQRTFADAGQDNGWAVARLLGAAGALEGYVVAGSRKEPGASAIKPWVMRLDAAGKELWQSFVAGQDTGAARAIAATAAGDFASAGARNVGLKQEYALWITSSAGVAKWSYVAGSGEARAVAIQPGALVAVGTSASGAEAGNLKVVRIALAGPGQCGP